jgi:hypothetical protein
MMMTMKQILSFTMVVGVLLTTATVDAWSMKEIPKDNPQVKYHSASSSLNRRQAAGRMGWTASSIATAVLVGFPWTASAGIDPALLQKLPVQGDESGTAQRLRQLEAIQRPSSDLVDIPFTELPSGVSFREYREGKGEAGK